MCSLIVRGARPIFCAVSRPLNKVTAIKMSSSSLTQDEVSRYSRQLIMPEIGVAGQKRMKETSVLVVGCGGLGCPASLYLTAAGIGQIGLIDADKVELSNLHRQVLHTEDRIGIDKTDSAVQALKPLNHNVNLKPITTKLTRANALEIVSEYDIVVDATDNVVARYLINDACVLTGKPLVSGSALRFDGQLTVYHYNETSPCYRCLFPTPPPAGTVTNCSDGGVIGVVPGIIGTLQALEVIKIAAGLEPAYAGQMLLFDGQSGQFRHIKIRNKRPDCAVCSPKATIGKELIDYEQFCGTPPCVTGLSILLPFERLSVTEYKEQVMDVKKDHVLIDVRPKVEQDIVKLPHSETIPLGELTSGTEGINRVTNLISKAGTKNVYVMCRRGNASQKAVRFLKDHLTLQDDLEIKDLVGGIEAWRKQIDSSIPSY